MGARSHQLFALSLWAFVCFAFAGAEATADSQAWPLPYRRVDSRPAVDPFCQALYPFCPGRTEVPTFDDDDEIAVFLLKAPVWEFKYGDLLGKFNVFHDAMGFRSTRTGLNYTLEWYELHQLLNCTFPHIVRDVEGNRSPLWCNQGAACFSNGIDDLHWIQNGSLTEVAVVSGALFNKFSSWLRQDNETGVFYETWTVNNPTSGQRYFDSYDCASFVLRAIDTFYHLGASFNHSTVPRYTAIVLYSEEPQLFWNTTEPLSATDGKISELVEFYAHFDSHQSFLHLLVSLAEVALLDALLLRKFFLFYNDAYFKLTLVHPFIEIRYDEIPLPT